MKVAKKDEELLKKFCNRIYFADVGEALRPYKDSITSSNDNYRNVELKEGDVVYVDKPYTGTDKKGYREGAMPRKRSCR